MKRAVDTEGVTKNGALYAPFEVRGRLPPPKIFVIIYLNTFLILSKISSMLPMPSMSLTMLFGR
jgi:hypothetical protein